MTLRCEKSGLPDLLPSNIMKASPSQTDPRRPLPAGTLRSGGPPRPCLDIEHVRHGERDEEAYGPGFRRFEHGVIETTMILVLQQGPR